VKLLLQVELTETQIRKIGWDLGLYPDDELPVDTDCKDWLEDFLQETFKKLPDAPREIKKR